MRTVADLRAVGGDDGRVLRSQGLGNAAQGIDLEVAYQVQAAPGRGAPARGKRKLAAVHVANQLGHRAGGWIVLAVGDEAALIHRPVDVAEEIVSLLDGGGSARPVLVGGHHRQRGDTRLGLATVRPILICQRGRQRLLTLLVGLHRLLRRHADHLAVGGGLLEGERGALQDGRAGTALLDADRHGRGPGAVGQPRRTRRCGSGRRWVLSSTPRSWDSRCSPATAVGSASKITRPWSSKRR